MGKYIPNTTGQVVVLYPPLVPNRGVTWSALIHFRFMNLGKELHLLAQLSDSSTRKVFFPVWQAQSSMRKLLNG